MIAIIDYGVGNINAFSNIYKKLNLNYIVASQTEHLIGISKIILPGVGAFDHAMTKFLESEMKPALDELVLYKKVPVLGICVGMQMLAQSSEEGLLPGLGWIDGTVKKLTSSSTNDSIRLPHMGWNKVLLKKEHALFKDLDQEARFYFLHSYYFECTDPAHILATSEYGASFASVIHKNNIFGIQCHPEKSHDNGITYLKNFGEL